MTLGMIWTIILRFAIQDITVEGVYWSEKTLDHVTRIERKGERKSSGYVLLRFSMLKYLPMSAYYTCSLLRFRVVYL